MNLSANMHFLIAIPDIHLNEFTALHTIKNQQSIDLIAYRTNTDLQLWLNSCPHAGRRMDWSEGKFMTTQGNKLVCAVHGAVFAPKNGLCISGPCKGQSLLSISFIVKDDAIYLFD